MKTVNYLTSLIRHYAIKIQVYGGGSRIAPLILNPSRQMETSSELRAPLASYTRKGFPDMF